MSAREGFTTNQLAVKLHDELAEEDRAEESNFASFLRVCCLRYVGVLAGRLHNPEASPDLALRAVR